MNIRRAFDTYDLDRNQVVNISEARGAINALGFSMIPDASFKVGFAWNVLDWCSWLK